MPRYCSRPEPRAKPVIDQVLPLLRQWLTDDALQPPKQRRTAHRMWRQLCDDHAFTGAESTVPQVVRDLKGETRPVFVPLAFNPASALRSTSGTAQVILNGEVTAALLLRPAAPSRDALR